MDSQEKEASNKVKEEAKKQAKKQSKKAIKKIIMAAIKAVIWPLLKILIPIILATILITSLLGIIQKWWKEIKNIFNGNPAYAAEGFTQYGNNTDFWFPILKDDIPSYLFNGSGGLPGAKGAGIVTSNFGPRNTGIQGASREHKGIDMGFAQGTKVIATKDGVVTKVRTGYNGGRGWYVRIDHGGGIESISQHLSGFADGIYEGKEVKQGEVIGFVGNTGVGSGAHLHFEIILNGTPLDPRNYLNFDNPWPDPITTGARSSICKWKYSL